MSAWMEVLFTVLLGLGMLIGLVGVVIPVLPDIILIWLSALLYGLLVGWGDKGPWLFAGISVLGVVGLLAEGWVSGVGARKGGASMLSILAGLGLGLVGLLAAGPLGLVVGMLLGTWLVEYLREGDPVRALRATVGLGVGYGASFVVKLALGLLMAVLWVVWLIVG